MSVIYKYHKIVIWSRSLLRILAIVYIQNSV